MEQAPSVREGFTPPAWIESDKTQSWMNCFRSGGVISYHQV